MVHAIHLSFPKLFHTLSYTICFFLQFTLFYSLSTIFSVQFQKPHLKRFQVCYHFIRHSKAITSSLVACSSCCSCGSFSHIQDIYFWHQSWCRVVGSNYMIQLILRRPTSTTKCWIAFVHYQVVATYNILKPYPKQQHLPWTVAQQEGRKWG